MLSVGRYGTDILIIGCGAAGMACASAAAEVGASVIVADLMQSYISVTLANAQTLLYNFRTTLTPTRINASTGSHLTAVIRNGSLTEVVNEKTPNLKTNGIIMLIDAIKISTSTKAATLTCLLGAAILLSLFLFSTLSDFLIHYITTSTLGDYSARI